MIDTILKNNQSPTPTDREWLEMYPKETRQMLREKLAELEPEATKLRQVIKDDFKKASLSPDDINTWLVYDYATEIGLVPRYIELKKQIKRFKWLLTPPRADKSGITEADIEHARQVLLEVILGHELRSAGGSKQKTLCPFHAEKTPSFIVYTDQNKWHCYGCGKSGDGISYVMEQEHLTFQEAVIKLKGY